MSTIIQQAEKLAQQLVENSVKLVTAESCTGGQLGALLTQIPGASAWFERGYITYSNKSKQELLAVSADTLKKFGAVSKETAGEMAVGALQYSHADYSIAITGIAGPAGGVRNKPTGTVYIAWGQKDSAIKIRQFCFDGDRLAIRNKSCLVALQGLSKQLL